MTSRRVGANFAGESGIHAIFAFLVYMSRLSELYADRTIVSRIKDCAQRVRAME